MTTYEHIYLGHDNVITLCLTADDEVVDISNTTRATAQFGSVYIDSDTSLSAFDWSEGEEGILHLTFGEETILTGSYKVVITLYDLVNPDGIVWDNFRCTVVGEDAVPIPPTDPPILISQGGTGQSTALNAFNALKQIATETYTGVAELATTDECVTGTDTQRVVTPAGLTAKISSVAPDRTYYVSQSFTADGDLHRFDTIQGAIDHVMAASWYGDLSDTNQALIFVGPGLYTEQIHSAMYIVIAGYVSGVDPLTMYPVPTLYNTGADAAHYPLRSDEDEKFYMVGINIETDPGGVIGKLPYGGFSNCSFQNGHFVERNSTSVTIMSECVFNGSAYGGFNLEGTDLAGYRNIILRGDCNIGFRSTSVFASSHVEWANLKMTNVDIEGNLEVGGDWDWRSSKCYTYRLDARNRLSTTGEVKIFDSGILNGLHFVSAPLIFEMTNSAFEGISDCQIPDGEPDITSDIPIVDATYSGNTQCNGLCGCVQITNPEKHVGGSRQDRYFNLQHAINSIPSGETATVRVWEDLTDLPEITLPNANTNIKIKGQKAYSLSFTGDIVEIGADRIFGFNDIVQLVGGKIELNGTSNEIGFESCQYINAYLKITNGAFAIIYKSSIFGPTGHPAIEIDTVTPIVVVGYSRVQGATGEPAVEFSVEADDKFKAKFSSFVHGDKTNICPLSNISGAAINIAVYLCGVNKLWSSPTVFYNTISKAGIIDDTEINF